MTCIGTNKRLNWKAKNYFTCQKSVFVADTRLSNKFCYATRYRKEKKLISICGRTIDIEPILTESSSVSATGGRHVLDANKENPCDFEKVTDPEKMKAKEEAVSVIIRIFHS